MKYLMTWDFRFNGSAAENEKTIQRALAVFSKWSPPDGATFHQFLARIDGGGGCAVVETDDPETLADGAAKFGFMADYHVFPMLEITDSVRVLQEGVEFRESVA